MMNFITHDMQKRLILFVILISLMIRANGNFFADDFEDYVNEDTSALNETLQVTSITKMKNLTTKSSSLSTLVKAFSTKHTLLHRMNSTKDPVVFKKEPISTVMRSKLATSRKISTIVKLAKKLLTIPPATPYVIVNNLVDQFNRYRNVDIISRIKQCDSSMKLQDMCETYSFDNHTYSLVRQDSVGFESLQHLYNILIDRDTVQRLSQLCPTGQWCLENLTRIDIRFTTEVLQKRGRSFCSLEKCAHQLAEHATACPSMSPRNISRPTLKLLPMLCSLYEEQQKWSTTKCTDEIAHLLHILYAFWPQLETCYYIITAGSGGCTSECLIFDTIFHQVESQCDKNASFLTRVPSLAWYRLVNLQQMCRHANIETKSPFISSVENLISSNLFWYRLHQRPVYAALFILLVLGIVISFSLCLYIMSKNDYDSNTRRFDDNYEYTRLHDSTFELGTNTEITDINSTSDRAMHESQLGHHDNHRVSENQRLLYMES